MDGSLRGARSEDENERLVLDELSKCMWNLLHAIYGDSNP